MSYKKSYNLFHNKHEKSSVGNKYTFISWFVFFAFILSLLFVYHDSTLYKNVTSLANISSLSLYHSSNNTTTNSIDNFLAPATVTADECAGKYIYIQDLPRQLNKEILENCSSLNAWVNMCNYLVNSGLGPRLNDSTLFVESGWYDTHQFSLEVIFHNKMKHYRCLTNDSSKAMAIFVPFYAGLDAGRYLWEEDVRIRDNASIELVKYLKQKPEWAKMSGKDHFLVVGRISWDFGRVSMNGSDWGNSLLLLPEVQNMTTLVLESNARSDADIAIPYPTYFHPSNDNQVFTWQQRMRNQTRPYLLSFVGGPRPNLEYTLRNEIISQCLGSNKYCKFVNCNSVVKNCEQPGNVMKLFEKSVFCLQPPGDSYTRRSIFDAMIAGCIPVFFHPYSAYNQYLWHLPKNYSSYSVFIPTEDVKKGSSVVKKLLEMSKGEVIGMREEVLKLIPRVSYAHPNSKLETLEDAFDVTVNEVLHRIDDMRVEIKD